jgi:ABC-type multidrug transport system ATPase subunit
LNGAGKTTTIEILTGQKRSSDGKAYLNGYDINSDRMDAIKSLGFCPQFDYLPEFLTVKQSLQLFLNLRGVKGNAAKMVLKEFMNAFKLNEFENKLVQNLRFSNFQTLTNYMNDLFNFTLYLKWRK